MASHRIVFNHVGLCVADTTRSRRFYEGLLGFEFWWELEPPDEGTDQLLQLNKPIGLRATYLVRDGLVLELLAYSYRALQAGPSRVVDRGAHPSVAICLGSDRRPSNGGQLRGIGD
jgi:lactoylglutathione lyase